MSTETAIEIRPFHVDVPDEALEDLRRRIAATNWQLFTEELRPAFRSLRTNGGTS